MKHLRFLTFENIRMNVKVRTAYDVFFGIIAKIGYIILVRAIISVCPLDKMCLKRVISQDVQGGHRSCVGWIIYKSTILFRSSQLGCSKRLQQATCASRKRKRASDKRLCTSRDTVAVFHFLVVDLFNGYGRRYSVTTL